MKLDNYIEFIKEKHKGQKRIQGTPYYIHPLEVSNILDKKGFSKEYQIVGLFHDLLEDTDTTYEELVQISNKKIADTVRLLTKEKGYVMSEYINRIMKNEMCIDKGSLKKAWQRLSSLVKSHEEHFEEA